jgi:uncharacterized protein (UPF0335 family)
MEELPRTDDLRAAVEKAIEKLEKRERDLMAQIADVRQELASHRKLLAAFDSPARKPQKDSQRSAIRQLVQKAGAGGIARTAILDAFPDKRASANANISMLLKSHELIVLRNQNLALGKKRS